MYGIDPRRAKQVAKGYVKQQAKKTVGKLVLNFLKSPPGLIILAILLIILAVVGTTMELMSYGTLTETLNEKDQKEVMNQIVDHVQKLNNEWTYWIDKSSYDTMKNNFTGNTANWEKQVDDINEVRIGSMVDFWGADKDLALLPAYVWAFFKVGQMKGAYDEIEGNDIDLNAWEIAKKTAAGAFNKIADILIPNRRKEKLKDELEKISEWLRPKFVYIPCKYTVEKIEEREYYQSYTVKYTPKISSDSETVNGSAYGTMEETVKKHWIETVKITEVKPIYVMVSAKTIKNLYGYEYEYVQRKIEYSGPNKVKSCKEDKLNQDVEPEEVKESTKEEILSTRVLEESRSGESPQPAEATYYNTEYLEDTAPELVRSEVKQITEMYPVIKKEYRCYPNDWKPLDDILKDKLDEKEPELAREYIIQTAEALIYDSSDPAWMLLGEAYDTTGENSVYVSSEYGKIGIPPAYMLPYFEIVADYFHIPKWFLLAVAFQESSFNPHAVNKSSDAYGMFQFMPFNWNPYARKVASDTKLKDLLGIDVTPDEAPEKARDDYILQIAMGGAIWYDYIKRDSDIDPQNVDWEGDGWKQQIINAIRHYSGHETIEDCLAVYCKPKLFRYADFYKALYSDKPKKIYPLVKEYEITSGFGLRNLDGKLEMHEGIDIGCPTGTVAVSVCNGTVKYAGPAEGFGNLIILQSEDKVYEFYYGHLEKFLVKTGDKVKIGDPIAYTDSTGRSKGPHLHFEVHMNGAPINPLDWLGEVNNSVAGSEKQ